jgi:hypothetical protein
MNEFSSHMFELNFLEYLTVLGLFGFFHHFFDLVIVVNFFLLRKEFFTLQEKAQFSHVYGLIIVWLS